MWQNPQETADLATSTKEMLNGKLHFLWSVCQFSIFTEFYVLVDIMIDIISKMKKWVGTSPDRDQV